MQQRDVLVIDLLRGTIIVADCFCDKFNDKFAQCGTISFMRMATGELAERKITPCHCHHHHLVGRNVI